MSDRIHAIARVIREDRDPSDTIYVIRRELRAERSDGYDQGYADCLRDRHEAAMLAPEMMIGPPLDHEGCHPEGDYSLWHAAVYIPDRMETDVCELLARNGIQVYRMWPVENPAQMKAALTELEESLKAGKDGGDDRS